MHLYKSILDEMTQTGKSSIKAINNYGPSMIALSEG